VKIEPPQLSPQVPTTAREANGPVRPRGAPTKTKTQAIKPPVAASGSVLGWVGCLGRGDDLLTGSNPGVEITDLLTSALPITGSCADRAYTPGPLIDKASWEPSMTACA
jgi:hypothetical protein